MTNRMDHTNCTHPRTPAGRRACRAGVSSTVLPIAAATAHPDALDYVSPGNSRAGDLMFIQGRECRRYLDILSYDNGVPCIRVTWLDTNTRSWVALSEI